MAADSTLVGAAFKEAAARAGTSVPNLKPLYESSVKQVKGGLGVITGIMDELKQDELDRIAGKDAQLQEFTELVNQMDKKLAIDKEPLPQKVIIAIEKGIKDLQKQFEDVNTYGDGDTRDNERARTRINGELQKLVNSAVNTRGGMMKIGKTIENINSIEFTDDDRAIASQMINLKDMDSDDRVSVKVVNGQITFTASDWKTSTIDGVKYAITGEGGEPVSWNIDQIIEAIPMKDLNADIRQVARMSAAQLEGAAAQAKGETMESYNLEGAVRDIKATIKTKKDFMNIAQRELEGTKIAGFRTGLLNSGELQLDLIQSMFTDDLGNASSLYDIFAALDKDPKGTPGHGIITSADASALTGEAKEIWKNNSMALIDMITLTRNKNFNLEVSKGIISNYLADHERQVYEKAWKTADKKLNKEINNDGNIIFANSNMKKSTFDTSVKPSVDLLMQPVDESTGFQPDATDQAWNGTIWKRESGRYFVFDPEKEGAGSDGYARTTRDGIAASLKVMSPKYGYDEVENLTPSIAAYLNAQNKTVMFKEFETKENTTKPKVEVDPSTGMPKNITKSREKVRWLEAEIAKLMKMETPDKELLSRLNKKLKEIK